MRGTGDIACNLPNYQDIMMDSWDSLERLTSEWTGTDTLSHDEYLLLLLLWPWDVAGGVVKAVAVRETVAIMMVVLISSAAPIDAAAALPVGVEAGEG